MKIFIALVAVLALVGVIVSQVSQFNAPVAGPVVPVTMPEDAFQIEDGISAVDILRSSMGMIASDEEIEDAATSGFIGMWVPSFGWNGEVRKIKINPDGTSVVSIYFEDITLPGNHFLIAELPGGHADKIFVGGAARVYGKISGLELASDPLTQSNRIIINPAELK